jgi:hypothetical protein
MQSRVSWPVIPPQAGIHSCFDAWTPASAGATRNASFPPRTFVQSEGVLSAKAGIHPFISPMYHSDLFTS